MAFRILLGKSTNDFIVISPCLFKGKITKNAAVFCSITLGNFVKYRQIDFEKSELFEKFGH